MKNNSLTQTLRGGGLKESPFNSKKIVLSLATISFLASYANATDTSNACPTTSTRSGSSEPYNKTLSSNCTQGITIPNTISNVTLTIESSGTLQAPNYSSNANSYAIELKG
ncbi:autotransporter, partial [Campylobacter jejuni]